MTQITMKCGIWPHDYGVGIALRLIVEDVTITWYTQSHGICVWGGDVVVCFLGARQPGVF